MRLINLGLVFVVFAFMTLEAGSPKFSEESLSVKKGIYQHYKGSFYEVLGVAHHSETLEELVVYRMLYEDFGYWVRPAEMFTQTTLLEGQEVPRFRYLGEPGNINLE